MYINNFVHFGYGRFSSPPTVPPVDIGQTDGGHDDPYYYVQLMLNKLNFIFSQEIIEIEKTLAQEKKITQQFMDKISSNFQSRLSAIIYEQNETKRFKAIDDMVDSIRNWLDGSANTQRYNGQTFKFFVDENQIIMYKHT